MAGTDLRSRGYLWIMGGMLFPSLFICQEVLADTITLKSGKDIKGLVVEQHIDRIVLSTEKGEIPILLKGIRNIKYDNPEQNFMQIGQGYEAQGKLGEALAYYEKALEANPDFQEARTAASGVRNRFWASSTEGPRNEMEKAQVLYDSWGQGGRNLEKVAKNYETEQSRSLLDGLGFEIEKKGDWVRVKSVGFKKAASSVLRKNDRLVSIDAQSLRYLSVPVVTKKLLLPRYSNFTLGFERDIFLSKPSDFKKIKDLGLDLKLIYDGLVVDAVESDTFASVAGLKEGDMVIGVNGMATRYMPLKKVQELILQADNEKIVFTIRRSALLARK